MVYAWYVSKVQLATLEAFMCQEHGMRREEWYRVWWHIIADRPVIDTTAPILVFLSLD